MSGSPPEKAERSAPIRAVTFDVGGTLIRPWPSVGHVYAEVAARHGLKKFSAEELNLRFKSAWQARKIFEHSRREWAELVNEVFGLASALHDFSATSILPVSSGVVNTRGRDARATKARQRLVHGRKALSKRSGATEGNRFFDELYQRFAEPEAWRIFDDVVPALDALKARGIRLGVISNWDERLPGLLRKLQLERYFEVFVISYEVGFPKPSPVIFRRAAVELDLEPEMILHVGDSLEMDARGAREAGFRAVQIDRAHEASDAITIRSLAELPGRMAASAPDKPQ